MFVPYGSGLKQPREAGRGQGGNSEREVQPRDKPGKDSQRERQLSKAQVTCSGNRSLVGEKTYCPLQQRTIKPNSSVPSKEKGQMLP